MEKLILVNNVCTSKSRVFQDDVNIHEDIVVLYCVEMRRRLHEGAVSNRKHCREDRDF